MCKYVDIQNRIDYYKYVHNVQTTRVLDSIDKNYTRKSIVYCDDCSFSLKGKIAFYKGEFVRVTSAKKLSKHTAEQYSGSIVECKALKSDQVSASFVIRYRKQNGKQYKSKVLTAKQVIEWVSKKSYRYIIYTL